MKLGPSPTYHCTGLDVPGAPSARQTRFPSAGSATHLSSRVSTPPHFPYAVGRLDAPAATGEFCLWGQSGAKSALTALPSAAALASGTPGHSVE